LHVTNKLVGHVFLVDGAGRVRWHGCGEASEEEVGSLLGLVDSLKSQQGE